MPITVTPEVSTFLDATTRGVAIPLLTITLPDGSPPLRWALHPTNVSFGGVTWLAHGRGGRPLIKSYEWLRPTGLDEIGTCEVVLGCDATTVLGSERLQVAAARGAFKRAKLLVEEAYAATLASAIVGTCFCWSGKIQGAPGDSHAVTLRAENVVADLKASQLPRTLVSGSCTNALYDPACGVSRAAHTSSRAVASGTTKNVVRLSGSDADAEWDGGTLTITSGALAGEKRGIREFTAGAAVLVAPLASAPEVGVTVTVTRGCDGTTGPGGCSKFANIPRFRAMPNLPKEG